MRLGAVGERQRAAMNGWKSRTRARAKGGGRAPLCAHTGGARLRECVLFTGQ